jgi:hypothetical protein
MENPILHNSLVRQHHIFICVFVGIAYALSFGLSFNVSPIGIATDALASCILFFGEAVILWSIFTYSRIEVLGFYQSVTIHIAYVCLSAIIMLLFEYPVMKISALQCLPEYFQSLPARVFCLIIIYVSFRRYYISNMADNDYDSEEHADIDNKLETVAPVDVIERITVKVGTKIKVIPVDEVIYFKAEDDYVSVVTDQGHWLKSKRLKDYEESLPSNKFARVHRSYIVNISKISKIERYGQKQMLSLNNGEQIRISMTGYKILKEKLKL